jgi:hypothetical protein
MCNKEIISFSDKRRNQNIQNIQERMYKELQYNAARVFSKKATATGNDSSIPGSVQPHRKAHSPVSIK